MKISAIRPDSYRPPPNASVGDLQSLLRRAAAAAFGDKDKTALWLTSINPRLNRHTPLDVATTADGLATAVRALLPEKKSRRGSSPNFGVQDHERSQERRSAPYSQG